MLKGLSVKYFMFFFILLWGSSELFAQSFKKTLISQFHPVYTFVAGASFSKLGQFESFSPLDLCRYTYQPNNSNTTRALWGGFMGSAVKQSPSWKWIVGLGYYRPNYFSTNGSLTQGADPTSDSTFSYKYQTQSQQLLAEGKMYWIAKETIQPFLMVGIGAAFNKTFNYQTSVPSFLEFTPTFSTHRQTNFTYAVGPGIDIGFSKSFRVGVAYRFTDLGLASTGSAQIDGISIVNTLQQSHLYANQIFTQFTYIP